MLFRVLGPLEVGDGDLGVAGMARRLLAALLIDVNRVVSVDRLLDALWGDAPPGTAVGTLHSHVSRLRAALTPLGERAVLVTRAPGYALQVDPDEVDAVRFERFVATARSAADPEAKLEALDQGLSLWRGSAYSGLSDADFARPAAVRLEELRLAAVEERVDALLALGRESEVLGEVEELVEAHPLRERFRAQLMVARHRTGRTVEALAAYREYRQRLADELGLEPSAHLRQLERDLLVEEPQLAAAAPSRAAAGSAAVEPPTVQAPPSEAPPSEPPRSSGPPQADTAALPAAERKLVSVLIADARAPSRIADPEELLAALEPVVAVMRAAVHRYEGTVHRVSSHGIAALFGAPAAQEDHAVRACYAALEALGAARDCGGVSVRVAVHSGEVLVRTVRTDLSTDYEAVGAAEQHAEQLLALTRPGMVTASSETVRLAAGRVDVAPLADDPSGAWTLLRAARRSPYQARTLRGLTAFAGRERELDELRARLADAAAGSGQVVAVVGEAGVGKSRLCAEFQARSLPDDWAVLAAAATPTDTRTPYRPLAVMLRSWLGLAEDAPGQVVRRAVAQRCTALGLGPAAVPALAGLLGQASDDPAWARLEPAQRRRRTHDAIVDLLLARAADRPLLWLVEDLHWLDGETQSVLDAVVDAAATAPLLVLVTYRPEHLPAWVNRSHATTLHLGPLRADGAEEFLAGLLGKDRGLAALKARLLAWTGGSPLFLEETVSALAEGGVLHGAPGAYHAVEPTAVISVPSSVHGVLAARFDRLPARQKELLQTAAVLGIDGPIELLLDCVDAEEDAVVEDLAALRRAEFLFERRGGLEVSFIFKHAITQDAVYATLPRSRRRALHHRVATAIRERYGERAEKQAARLGHHAFGAEDWHEAARLLRRAGEQALDASAHHEATGLLEQAVEALGHLEATPEAVRAELDARVALRPALAADCEMARSLVHLARAEELARQIGDRQRLVIIKVHQSFNHDLLGHVGDAVTAGEEGLRIARQLRDDVLVAEARLALAQAYALSGDPQRTLAVLEPSMALLTGELRFQRHGMAGVRGVWALGHSALARTLAGDFALAAALADEAAAVAETGGRAVDRGFAAFVWGFLALERGESGRAVASLQAGDEVTREGGVALIGMWNRAYLGRALAQQHDLDGAGALLREVLSEVRRQDVPLVQLWARTALSEVALAKGDPSGAAREADGVLEMARRWNHPFKRVRAQRLLGQAAACRDDLAAAASHLEAALATAQRLGLRPEQAHGLLARGRVAARAGRRDAARGDLRHAADLYTALGTTRWADEARDALHRVD